MTKNEVKAIKWMKCVKDDAVVTLDYIAKNEPNVSPMLYTGRKGKAETIINGFEELEQYRSIGTIEECREARERQRAKKTGTPYMDGYGNTKAECLNCHCTIMYPSNYCKFCGQKLDWTDTP